MSDEPLQPNNSIQNNPPDMLGEPYWTANPVENGASTTLTVPIEYKNGKVVTGEYFGNNDPGNGNGKIMEVKDDHLSVTIKVDLPVGSHPLNIRAKSADGTWSSLEPTVLTVMTTPIILPDANGTTA